MLELDHIAVVGATLEEASAAVEDMLAQPLEPGGKHPDFGTHNRLLGLAGGRYLEVIAIDPAAPDPGRARWFDMDRFAGSPRLTNWICRTDDIAAAVANYPQAGRVLSLARGDLQWQAAVPDSGILPFDNLFPMLIRWQRGLHPSDRLPDRGCALRRLVVSHPQARDLASLLPDPGAGVVFETGPPGLMAEIDTPRGMRVLR